MRDTVTAIIKGAVIGVANIIPGVSGGTMALVLGFYDRLIHAISHIATPATLGELRDALRGDQRSRALKDFCVKHDLPFLALLAIGAVAAIAGLSQLLGYLLETQYVPTYGFFFGLVAASILVPWTLLRRRSWKELTAALVAACLTITLPSLQSAEERLEAAQQKHALEEAESAAASAPGSVESEKPGRELTELAWFFLVGAVAISAMILPGVSGSFLLLLFGAYFDVIEAINEWDPPILAALGLGCVIGVGVFTKLLNFLLKRYYSPTMAFLAGLMVGSLWSLWPFKVVEYVGSRPVPMENSWPTSLGAEEWTTIGTTLAGAIIVIAFFLYDQRRTRTEQAAAEL